MRHARRRRHHRNPKRRHAKRYMMVGKKYSHNPRRKHYRRHYRSNPISMAMGGTSMKSLLPMVLSVSAGVIAVDAIPLLIGRFLPSATTGVMAYAAKAGAIIGGGMVAKKFGGKEAQVAFIAGGIGKVVLDFVGNSIIGMVANVAAPAAVPATTAGYGAINRFGAYSADESLGAMSNEDSIY